MHVAPSQPTLADGGLFLERQLRSHDIHVSVVLDVNFCAGGVSHIRDAEGIL
jgi:hypothetical protein